MNANEDVLKWTTSGLLLPHEIFGSLYNYMEGQLFFALLAGIPGETWLHALRFAKLNACKNKRL